MGALQPSSLSAWDSEAPLPTRHSHGGRPAEGLPAAEQGDTLSSPRLLGLLWSCGSSAGGLGQAGAWGTLSYIGAGLAVDSVHRHIGSPRNAANAWPPLTITFPHDRRAADDSALVSSHFVQ